MLRVFRLLTLLVVGVLSALCAVNLHQSTQAKLRESEPAHKGEMDLNPSPVEPSSAAILDAFVCTESRVREQLNPHTFKREVVLQTIGPNSEVAGEYVRYSQFLFDDQGNRIEHVTYHPPSTFEKCESQRRTYRILPVCNC